LEGWQAYGWLAKELGIPGAKCHIGNFDAEHAAREHRFNLMQSQRE